MLSVDTSNTNLSLIDRRLLIQGSRFLRVSPSVEHNNFEVPLLFRCLTLKKFYSSLFSFHGYIDRLENQVNNIPNLCRFCCRNFAIDECPSWCFILPYPKVVFGGLSLVSLRSYIDIKY